MPRRTHISSILFVGAMCASACTHRQEIDLRQEFEEARTNCGLRRLIMQASPGDRRVLLVRFPQRYDAHATAEADGSWACLNHWARERNLTLRLASHQELQGE